MSEESVKIAVNESFNGEDVIPNLIETARNLLDSDITQAKDFFEKALLLSKNNHYHSGIGECLLELGKIDKKFDNSIAAYKQIRQASGFFEKTDDFNKMIECNSIISDIALHIGNYGQALESCLKSLAYAKKINSPELSGRVYNKTGKIYKVLGDYKKAIDHHQSALDIYSKINHKSGISQTCYYIGRGYNLLDNSDEAFHFLDKSLTIADEINDPELQVKPTGSLAILFTKLKQTDRAKDFFYRAIDIVNITGDLALKADLLRNLGKLFIETAQFDLAMKSLSESLEIAESINIKSPLHLIHKSIADVYELTGDYKNSLYHFKKYNSISSELLNEQVALKSKGIQLKYNFEEANREKDLADKAIMLKDRFIASISHEIRTPLNGVLGMADLLSDTKPTPEQLDYINTIKLSANNLIGLISDILDFSKIQAGEISIEKSEFSFHTTVLEIEKLLKVVADEKLLNISFKLDDQIPEKLIGDAVRLKQVLMNILTNAIKFTDSGHVKLEVKITHIRETDIKLLFTISDTGKGIGEDKIDTIFESFAHVGLDNSLNTGGAGLGLAIVKQLVDLQGGTILVNSKIGSGTVFKVELPFKLAVPFKNYAGPVKTGSNNVPKNLSEVVILLVEDNKVNQFLAQKLLSKMGFGVVIANNGNEAIHLLKTRKFNLILMDVQMPEMNGYELTEIIRNTLPDNVNKIPIIALTAYASTQEKEKAFDLGMSDYITKPYSPHELMTSIMKQVGVKTPDESILAESVNAATSFDPETIRDNTEKLLQLFNGSISDVLSLLHMLINQIPLLLDEAEVNIKNENWTALFQTMHKLKSSVNLLKVKTLVNYVDELEELSRDQMHTDRIPVIYSNLRTACEKAVTLLKEETIRLKKTGQPK